MKKILIILIALLFLIISNNASADWTISVSQEKDAKKKTIVKIELTSDGSALAQDIWTDIVAATDFTSSGIVGLYIYRLKTDPDNTNAPSSTYELTIIDALGDTATLAARSTTAIEYALVSDVTTTGGFLTMYKYLYLTCEDIGDGNKTVLYLELIP